MNVSKVLAGTGILIGVYLAVAYATGFGKAVTSVGNVYTSGVKVLQGRG